MSTVKSISTPYVIHTVNTADPIVLDPGSGTGNVVINGNLQILGTGSQTIINTANTSIYDTVITLNAGFNSVLTPSSTLESGFEINRGDARLKPRIEWREAYVGATTDKPQGWSITFEKADQTVAGPFPIQYYEPGNGGFNIQRLADDPKPALGANLQISSGFDVRAIPLFSSNVDSGTTGNVRIDSNLSLRKYSPVITSVTNNYNTITASNVGQGGTGLYVTSDEGGIRNEELISKRRAIVYSIIF